MENLSLDELLYRYDGRAVLSKLDEMRELVRIHYNRADITEYGIDPIVKDEVFIKNDMVYRLHNTDKYEPRKIQLDVYTNDSSFKYGYSSFLEMNGGLSDFIFYEFIIGDNLPDNYIRHAIVYPKGTICKKRVKTSEKWRIRYAESQRDNDHVVYNIIASEWGDNSTEWPDCEWMMEKYLKNDPRGQNFIILPD